MTASGAAGPEPDADAGPRLRRVRKVVALVCLLLVLARALVAPYQKLFPGPWWVDWLTFLVPMGLFILCIPKGRKGNFVR